MKPLSLFSGAALSACLMAGCDNSTAPERPLFSAHAAQRSEPCHAVRGTIVAQVVPGGAIGTIHGDLEGTIITVLGPDPVGNTEQFVTGTIVHLSGYQTVEVTGGSISALLGRTIVWLIESRAVDLPPIRRVSSTLTIVEGATGNLVSHGVLDLATLTTNFDYAGEICP